MTKTRRILAFAAVTVICCSLFLVARIKFHFHSEVDGFFILEGEKGAWLELTDDLTPEDAPRLLWAMPLKLSATAGESQKCGKESDSCLDFHWNSVDGQGFIRNTWNDGRKLIINIGRFRESNGSYPAGLFIGGGLPPSDPDYQYLNNNATGMTYFDGERWHHIWCNVNEGIHSPSSPFTPSYPSDWEFKGSRILENDGINLTIGSRHRIILAGVPLDFERVLFYRSGGRHVTLVTEITNMGTVPSTLLYQYADEPWVGNFGSSAGDVGWTKKEILFTEREVDVKEDTFIGMFDYGNPLAGENHIFSGMANFMEWSKDPNERPDKAYVSNFIGGVMHGAKPLPLVSIGNRIIGLKWGPRRLVPGESFHFTIAVGMADNDPKTGMPIKPKTGLNR